MLSHAHLAFLLYDHKYRVSNNGLPAVFAIHRSLKSELAVENRVGATFGKCYCGVVGGVRRHEFAVMGAPVNLAARLMASKVNKGILVDEAVSEQADSRFTFNNLPPVEAKGYDHPVAIFEPTENTSANKRKKSSSLPFIGRSLERETVINVSSAILETPEHAQITMVFLMGESGMGKSALASMIADDIKKKNNDKTDTSKTIICAKSSSSETQQRIPLRYVSDSLFSRDIHAIKNLLTLIVVAVLIERFSRAS